MVLSTHLSADELIAGLRRAGLRVTAPRRSVCAVLAGCGGEHLTAADVASRAGAAVDLSTVYRTLDALEGLGMVEHVHLGHGAGAYHVGPSAGHHHLVCDTCGRTVDVPLGDLERAIEQVTAPLGFVPDSAHFAIVGRCAACAVVVLRPLLRPTAASPPLPRGRDRASPPTGVGGD